MKLAMVIRPVLKGALTGTVEFTPAWKNSPFQALASSCGSTTVIAIVTKPVNVNCKRQSLDTKVIIGLWKVEESAAMRERIGLSEPDKIATAGLSLRQVARKHGISRASVCRW
jgi:hypothetical protein